MMIIVTQTDTMALSGAVASCSGATLAGTRAARQVTDGGTAGTTEATVTISAGNSEAAIMFESASGQPTNTDWAAGNWIVDLNVTSGKMGVSLEDLYVCRVNSAGVSQATVGSVTNRGINLGSPGVVSCTISGSAQTASPGDRFYIVLVLRNANSHTSQSIGFTPDQTITTPIVPIDGFRITEVDDTRVIEGTDPTDIRVTENFV